MKAFLQHRITKNVGALAILQVFMYAAPLVILVYMTRILTPYEYGVLAFSVGIIQFSNSLLDFGLTQSATPRISIHRHRPQMVSRILGSAFALKLAGNVVIGVAIAIYALTTVKYERYSHVLLCTLLPILGHSLQPVWLFQGIERMSVITKYVAASKIIHVALIVLIVRSGTDLVYVVLAEGMASLVGATLALRSMAAYGYKVVVPTRRDLRYVLKFTTPFIISRFAITTYTSGAVGFIGLLASPPTTATYAIGERMYQALQQCFYPVVQAAYPYMAKERNVRLLVQIGGAMLVGAALLSGVLYFFSAEVIGLLFGPQWSASVPVLHVFLIAIVAYVLNLFSGFPMSAALGTLATANNSLVGGAVVYLAAVAFLWLTGSTGAVHFACALLAAEMYVLFHRACVNWPKLPGYMASNAGNVCLWR